MTGTPLSDRLDRLATAGLLVSIVLIPITRSVVLPIVGPRMTAFELVAAPTILVWLLARTVSRSWATIERWPGLDVALIAFWVIALLSGITAYRMLGSAALVWFLTEVVVLTYLLLFFFMARDLLVRQHAIGSALKIWAVSALVVGFVGIFGVAEMLQCNRPLSSLVYSSSRLLSTFRNPNQLAAFMVPTSLLLAGWCASRLDARARVLAGAAAACSAAVLFYSASRGGAVAFTLGLLFLVLFQRSSPMRRTVGALVVIFGLLIGSVSSLRAGGNSCFVYLGNTVTAMTVDLPASLASALAMLHLDPRSHPADVEVKTVETPTLTAAIPMGGDTATSFAFRGVMARIAFQFALQHPFTGVGLGTMHVHIQRATNETADLDAHNMAMTVLAETGFLGLALFAWCLAWCVWTAYAAFAAAPDDPMRALRAGLLVALIAFLVMTLSFDGQRQRVLWMLLAMICASARPGALGPAPRRSGDA